MSKKLVYQDADGEKLTLPNVKELDHSNGFFKVTYRPLLGSVKTSMIKEDRVIRYDIPYDE